MFELLLILGIFTFGVFLETKKAKKNVVEDSIPAEDDMLDEIPSPVSTKEIEKPFQHEPLTTSVTDSQSVVIKRDFKRTYSSSLKSQNVFQTETPSQGTESAEESSSMPDSYAINSAEDAKKAIIWSEILQRKF